MKSLEGVKTYCSQDHQSGQDDQVWQDRPPFHGQSKFIVALLATDTMTDLYIDEFYFGSAVGAFLLQEHNVTRTETNIYHATRTYSKLLHLLNIDHNSDSHLGITRF